MADGNCECDPNEDVILICVDDSQYSMSAFDWYHRHFHRAEHMVLLVHIYTSPEVASLPGHRRGILEDLAHDEFQKGLDEILKKSAGVIQKYQELCKDRGIKCRAVTKERCSEGVGHGICCIANDNHANCIVMGQRGLGSIKRKIFGSVSDYVLHNAKRSVLVVSPETKDRSFSK